MVSHEEYVSEILRVVKDLGIDEISPKILSDAGNLTVHLAPYPLIARVAKQLPGHSAVSWKEVLERELRVAHHLSSHGIAVVPYATSVPMGPHKVGNSWMTLWEYITPVSLPAIEPKKMISMVVELSQALEDFPDPLPRLKVWKNVTEATEILRKIRHYDDRIPFLMRLFEMVDEEMESQDTLFAAHGDAHLGNLMASENGWLWNDFEDVSLMPRFWDLVSLIGNTALFNGLTHPVVDYALNHYVEDKSSFKLAITARVIMATTTNLALALSGNGDLDFAVKQLTHIKNFIDEVNQTL